MFSKKLIGKILGIVFIFSFFSLGFSFVAEAENLSNKGVHGANLTWFFDEANRTLEISGVGKMEKIEYKDGLYSPPWKEFEEQIERVVVNEGVTSISQSSFYFCNNILTLSLPDGLLEIGKDAFHDCTSLKNINIPDSVEKIGEGAFWDCRCLSSLAIPKGVKIIENYAFSDCSSLKELSFKEGLESIGDYAFKNTGIINLTIPKSVKSIGVGAFKDCSNLAKLDLKAEINILDKEVFSGCALLRAVEIPSTVTRLNENVFLDCDSLEALLIPVGVLEISSNAFGKKMENHKITIYGNKSSLAFIFVEENDFASFKDVNNPAGKSSWNNLMEEILTSSQLKEDREEGIEVYFNDEKLTLDQVIIIENGRTLVPIREVLEKMGMEVTWDSKSQTIKAVGKKTILLTINSFVAFVDGESCYLEASPKIILGRTMLPLRFVSESLGAEVVWQKKTNTININY